MQDLVYESNPKHGEPWQRGRRGSVCSKVEREAAAGLLKGSVSSDDYRYATMDGQAFCAQEHAPGRWHGYPIGWKEVPEPIRRKWIKGRIVTRQDVKRHWDS